MSFTPRITKLNNGLQIPTVGLGCWQIRDKSKMKELVKLAIKVGYRHIDTATSYTNEDAIGDALEEVFADESYGVTRKDIWVTSKLSFAEHGYENAINAVEKSLSKLKLDYIDLYIIHFPGSSGRAVDDPELPSLRKASWLGLEEMHKRGKVRAIGVSNYQIRHLDELMKYATITPVVNQCEFHPLLISTELRAHTKKLGINFEAYSSLGEGNLVNGNYTFEELDTIARAHGASIAQILLCWGMQQGAIVLPKSSSEARLIENFECQKFTLTQEEMDQINNISSKVTKRFCWDPSVVQ
ncbi:hypothetical protein BB558_002965 [Smittium angustum]|uniref:NADP-dependent oxidoreductase domain-containing protein n=2 Tax=Smittium angustum TaxID=133377 RepID=A0A2U1J758_SMIAN|nr:hypothetical protein BB558_002965 [Smittium angustum]